jgi:hypothetical protein
MADQRRINQLATMAQTLRYNQSAPGKSWSNRLYNPNHENQTMEQLETHGATKPWSNRKPL